MKIVKSVNKINNSLYVNIPKKICDLLDIHESDLVEFDVQKVDPIIKTFKCLACGNIFDMLANQDLYCSSCDEENAILDISEEIKDADV